MNREETTIYFTRNGKTIEIGSISEWRAPETFSPVVSIFGQTKRAFPETYGEMMKGDIITCTSKSKTESFTF